MRRVGIIGFGAIASGIARHMRTHPVKKHVLTAALIRPSQKAAAEALMPVGSTITSDARCFIDAQMDIVIEAAGQQAVRDLARPLLRKGCELQVLSAGVLADSEFFAEIERIAEESGARVTIPAGALAGFRGLLALRHAGLESVTYTSTKPPSAWRGTPADDIVALDRVDQAVVLFHGSAREAALRFPKNANLAAAVALAGVGFEKTTVRLIADPGVVENTGQINAVGASGHLDLTMSGPAFENNPKSSEITGWSVIAALRNSVETIGFA